MNSMPHSATPNFHRIRYSTQAQGAAAKPSGTDFRLLSSRRECAERQGFACSQPMTVGQKNRKSVSRENRTIRAPVVCPSEWEIHSQGASPRSMWGQAPSLTRSLIMPADEENQGVNPSAPVRRSARPTALPRLSCGGSSEPGYRRSPGTPRQGKRIELPVEHQRKRGIPEPRRR